MRLRLEYSEAIGRSISGKQETLEDAYLNKLIDEANKEFSLDRKLAKEVAIKFAKWQQERMYSEEEVEQIFNIGQMVKNYGDYKPYTFKEALKQFKQK